MITAQDIAEGFILGYHGGWDATALSHSQVVAIERERSASHRQIDDAARRGILSRLAETAPTGPIRD